MTTPPQQQPPRIYSYVRFSSERQLKGDSLKRQNEMIDRYTKQKGYELDSAFRYVDVGVPAFRGQNLKDGKLRLFIEAIRENKVPVGSVLLVESLDRITRLKPMEALGVFSEIINAGIKIVTLTDGIEHSNETTGHQQMLSLMSSVTTLCRAHEESSEKSRRLKSAWVTKRKNIKKEFYTSRIPRWLQLSDDKVKIVQIPEKVDAVKRMFKLCIEGNNAEQIAKVFRKDKTPLVAGGKAWTHSYIAQSLRNEAVTGRFTPHRMENGKRVPASEPILDYYPQIVSENDFARVQHIMDSRSKNTGGRVAKIGDNLFRKKLFCGYCGAAVYVNYKGRYYKGGPRKTLICRNVKDDTGCFCVTWDYWEFESAFIAAASELHAMLKDKFQGSDLRKEIQEISGKIKQVNQKLERFENLIEKDGLESDQPKTIIRRMKELEGEQESLQNLKDLAERKLSAGMEGPKPLANLAKLAEKLKDADVRAVVADLIAQLFERIDVFAAGTKVDFAKLKRMHAIQVKKWGKNDGHVKAYLRDNFDRRKVRFFQPVLSIPGMNKRLTFSSNGKAKIEARLDLVEDLPDNADVITN